MSIFAREFYTELKKYFQYEPTAQQDTLMQKLSLFIGQKQANDLFIIKGYAGTGKTSLISAMVKLLRSKKRHLVLLAPTGRAAKVLSGFSNYVAHTIHRRIFFASRDSNGNIKLKLQQNKLKNAIFIVDEASMIPDYKPNSRDILSDLIKFVYTHHSNKMIFIGDTAQLPPVGLEISPALDKNNLKKSYDLNIYDFELTEVLRQAAHSGILDNATLLRDKIFNENFELPFFDLNYGNDILFLPGYELQDELESAYYNYGYEDTVLITRSNKRAYLYNMEIRKRILQREEEIEAGDMIMIVKNNYFWLDDDSQAGFLANGDIIEIISVQAKAEKFGFRFADVTVRLVDYPNEPQYDLKIILDTLSVEAASLNREQNNKLFSEVLNSYSDEKSRTKRMEKLKKDKYFNALQVKYAYALTCHKTQGGQWFNVFVDYPFVKEEEINKDYLRWMYTAVTRASDKVFLINFPESFY